MMTIRAIPFAQVAFPATPGRHPIVGSICVPTWGSAKAAGHDFRFVAEHNAP
jgi:hypothetical protein